MAPALSGAFGGLLAYGPMNLHGAKGLAGWRWLFLVEGTISIAGSIATTFLVPDNFEIAWWLKKDEKAVMRSRYDNTRLYQGNSVPTHCMKRSEVKLAFHDPKIWLNSACQVMANVCRFDFSSFLPVIVRGSGYSSVRTQLLTVPVYIWASVVCISISFASDYVRRRAFFMVPLVLITAVGYAMQLSVAVSSTTILYISTFITATDVYCVVSLNVTWIINNSVGYFKRATAIGLQQTIGNNAGIMVGQFYRITDSGGRYVIGHPVSLTTITLAACGYVTMYFLLRRLNQRREAVSIEKRIQEINFGTIGDRHLGSRYTL